MVLIMIMSVVSMVSLNSMISKLIVFKPRKQLYPKGYYEAQGYEALEAKLNQNTLLYYSHLFVYQNL